MADDVHMDQVRRFARVAAVHADVLELELEAGACAGCADGCGGRCNLFANVAAPLRLPLDGRDWQPGQRVALSLSRRALRRAAFRGYGLALLGMLVGAGLGAFLARVLGVDGDPLVAVGLFAGLLGAVRALARTTVNPALTLPWADS